MTKYKKGRAYITQGEEPETSEEILRATFIDSADGMRRRERELRHSALDEALNGETAERQGNTEEAQRFRRASERAEQLAHEYGTASEVLEGLAQKYYNVQTEAEQEQEGNDDR